MKNIFTFVFLCISAKLFALDPNHFTITRISAPYFIVDANSPSTITKSYVGFEVKNNSNSGTTYAGLKFTITSIGTSVSGQDYSLISPVSGIINVGTLAPGETKVCYYYVSYPANTTPQATFNIQLSDNTANSKTQSFVVYNRSSISANAGGTATQTFTNQDIIGGLVYDDVTYAVGNVQNGDESDFQVAVSSMFDPTKITLLSTEVTASTVPGIVAGATDSLYFITGNGSNGATITIRWTFRISATNFTTYLLPCAGATSGATNYKYALNTNLGSGTPITVSSTSNPLTITKTSDQSIYSVSSPAIFTITITNPGAYGVSIDKIIDELPTGFTFQSFHAASNVVASNSTSVPATGVTGTITFEGGVSSGGNNSYYIAAGGSLILKYTATTSSTSASNLLTTVRDYVGTTEVGSAQNTVSVSATLPATLLSFNAGWLNDSYVKLNWATAAETNSGKFEIEKSSGAMPFRKTGELASAGSSSSVQWYSFIDSFPAAGNNQYRLKMIDKDNRYTYSPVISLNKKQEDFRLQNIFPNPFINGLNVQIVSDKAQAVQLQFADISGRIVYCLNTVCSKGVNNIFLDKPGGLQAGIYLLKLNTGTEAVQQKLVKVQ
ncbi:MAG TPA: T9SS type A sorting domain-containing protein [Chitinophagaceae bacterium]|nr:T9SS type A sorting domain-containing protein [Chitinophagaceae bacterium]